jgi:hypothetical protein
MLSVAVLSVIMLGVIMLGVIMLSVIIPGVVALFFHICAFPPFLKLKGTSLLSLASFSSPTL